MREWWPVMSLACRPPEAERRVARQGDGWLSHADFLARVDRWQHAFEAQAQTSWALFLTDPLTFAAALLGAWHAGKTVALPGDDRSATLAALAEMGFGMAGDLPGGLQASAVLDQAIGRQSLDLHATRLKVFTSGSQGKAQAIDKTLRQLWSEVEALEQVFGASLDGTDAPTVVWATVSHQHIYGLLFQVLWPLAAGRPIGAPRLLYPEDMISALASGPSLLVATPAHLKRLGEHLDWPRVRPTLRAVFSSGGPLPYEVAQEAADLMGRMPIEVFGSSETGGIAWRQATAPDVPWQPFPEVSWRLDDGCLALRSPRLPDDAWLTTADRAEAVGESRSDFRLLGRQDRIVKIEEKRVSLTAMERALLATPWVQDVKALVVVTPIGERVAAVVVPSAEGQHLLALGPRALTQPLKEALSSSCDPVAVPRRWRFVDALPANEQGKTPEALLKDLFADAQTQGLLQPAMPEMPPIEWRSRGEAEALAVLDIHAGLSVFKGHFDKAAILPGVAQLDWTLMLGHACFALPAQFVRLEALKFVNPVTPGTALHVSLQCKVKPGDPVLTVLQFRLYSQRPDPASGADLVTEHASGRAVWQAEEGLA